MSSYSPARFVLAILLVAAPANAQTLFDTIGISALRALDPTLTGSGVNVAQAEAGESAFEVNPAATGQPVSLFTYWSAAGSASAFPNSIGSESAHANTVGNLFYGAPRSGNEGGVAPGVAHVDNYQADYFFEERIQVDAAINASVVNQSFVFTGAPRAAVDQYYDDYASRHGTLFVSGVGNGDGLHSPGTQFNGLAVGAYGGSSSVGPTSDGRSKPDITAPAGATSFSTPLVAGAAAILIQAANRDGTNAAAGRDPRTIRALLLNGAVKPADWTHTATSPLDPRYGAGVLNVFNSHQDLAAGRHTASLVNNSTTPFTGAGNGFLGGWDMASLTSNFIQSGVAHYVFDLSAASAPAFTLTSTLAWQRQAGETGINNLDLFLYQSGTGTLVDSSVSSVDSVEHLFTQNLAPGKYDLQVVKRSGLSVSNSETYSLAFHFVAVPEPGGILLILLGFTALAARRHIQPRRW
jgi:hypothetical protein